MRQLGASPGHLFSAYFSGWAAFTDSQNYSSLCNFTLFPFQKPKGNIERCWNKTRLKLTESGQFDLPLWEFTQTAQRNAVAVVPGDQRAPYFTLWGVRMLLAMVLDERTSPSLSTQAPGHRRWPRGHRCAHPHFCPGWSRNMHSPNHCTR